MEKVKKFLKQSVKFLKQSAIKGYKHFVVFGLIAHALLSTFSSYFEANMPSVFQQSLLAFVFCAVANYGFEIIQKNRMGGNDSINEIFSDSFAAAIGGVAAVLIFNI